MLHITQLISLLIIKSVKGNAVMSHLLHLVLHITKEGAPLQASTAGHMRQ
jgi:hypothetical protein